MRFTHHFWRDIASGASYASYTSKTPTIGFGISINIDDLDEDDSAIYERLLEIYHEYDNDFKSDILELIESHSKLSKVATV